MIVLTRQYRFSSAHKLHNPKWDAVKNKEVFGGCNRLHGHNYTLEIGVTGEIDPTTGLIYNIKEFDALIENELIPVIDHCYLDEDVPFLKGTLSTVENLARAIYDEVSPQLPTGVQLHKIRLYESPDNWVDVNEGRQL